MKQQRLAIQNEVSSNGQARGNFINTDYPEGTYKELCVALIDCIILPTKSVAKFQKSVQEHIDRVVEEASVPIHKQILNDMKRSVSNVGNKILMLL